MSETYVYHPDIPESCPLDGAEPVGTIYRSVQGFPPLAADFDSDVEANKPNAKRGNCKHWGCSVWQDLQSAEHARKVYDTFRTSYIVVGDLQPSAGQVLATPSKAQPGHATFWKVHGLDVSSHFRKLLDPILPQQDDPLGPM
ncbi:hypothetical protein [Rhodopseudomonas pseudopalustris]|uniref:Uncharacterized protein n=1 Tax=Rhodopseudomonas pseudopalustris TaxID=1513892 RepID=A0A1H8V5P0_9BRAD|nr:hypothetical protein [Rhodopseudomonas pseudopalustris]SEP10573.1 hypothetical protein SAMN05444123_10853 [Rhodopseudomonas pseudopalustris]